MSDRLNLKAIRERLTRLRATNLDSEAEAHFILVLADWIVNDADDMLTVLEAQAAEKELEHAR